METIMYRIAYAMSVIGGVYLTTHAYPTREAANDHHRRLQKIDPVGFGTRLGLVREKALG